MYKRLIRPLLFLLSPEKIHLVVVSAIKLSFLLPGFSYLLRKIFSAHHPSLHRTVFGLEFSCPVGLAAGFDKNAEVFNQFSHFGFSFIEVGTVTPRPQLGNPKPRSFRLTRDKALINRMGFNNKGVNFAVQRLRKRKGTSIVGGNIGKNTDTPNSEAVNDYLYCFKALYPLVDYLVVNISCPNVTNLRSLQDGEQLQTILTALTDERARHGIYKPILLKVSPDLSFPQLDETISIAEGVGLDGFIATNTTTSRDNLTTDPDLVARIGNGGLSGAPLTTRATEIIRYIAKRTSKPIVAAGGIMSSADALEKLSAGASLVQLYTGFIFEGPFLVKRINKMLIK